MEKRCPEKVLIVLGSQNTDPFRGAIILSSKFTTQKVIPWGWGRKVGWVFFVKFKDQLS